MTQNDYFTLIFGKAFEHFAYAIMALPFHHACFSTVVSEVEHFKDVFVFTIADGWRTLYFAEVVHTKIMGDSHSPGKKLSFFRIAAAAHRINNADKNILEDVFGEILVLY